MSYKDTRIWREAYGMHHRDSVDPNAQRLSSALDRIYQNSSALATQIWADQPGFTAHDASHMTALWELADLICGEDLTLNPVETFIFGSAIFFHDLAMTLAALPMGKAEITNHPSWSDAIAVEFRQEFGRTPSKEEIENPPAGVAERVTRLLLRERHAELAESLPTADYVSPNDSSMHLYLMEDSDLRLAYGSLIGRIAASHGWSVADVTLALPERIGAPFFAPISWSVDVFPLAMLLRCADAIHLDAGRAPLQIYATQKLTAKSADHWKFHQHLQRPYVSGDRIVFSTARPFSKDEVEAWWLCVDSLRTVDHELRDVDVALADLTKPRLRVRSVAGVQSLARVAQYVQTDGWEPVDARVHVGDVVGLVSKLGGEQLYGEKDIIALRELVLNAIDAVSALAVLSDATESSNRGRVRVSLEENSDGWTLVVDDNGIGMPPSVLTGALLDFGNSFWGKPEASRLYPGLQSRGFASTGRYGIGFFSAFMWGDRVKVVSRPYYSSMEDTYILEFQDGLSVRPIMRRAETDERRSASGTSISIKLDQRFEPCTDCITLLITAQQLTAHVEFPLARLLAWLFPASEVRLEATMAGSHHVAVEAGDWRHIDGKDLLTRIRPPLDLLDDEDPSELNAAIEEMGPRLRDVRDESDELVGRLALLSQDAILVSGAHWQGLLNGLVTVGGARTGSTLAGIAGLLIGSSVRVTREIAVPVMSRDTIVAWAKEAAILAKDDYSDPECEVFVAEAVMRLSADTGPLVLFKTEHGWLGQSETVEWARSLDQVRIVHPVYIHQGGEEMNATLDEDVLIFETGHYPALAMAEFDVRHWPLQSTGEEDFGFGPTNSLLGRVFEALVKAWDLTAEQAAEIFPEGRRNEMRKKEPFASFEGKRLRARVLKFERPRTDKADKASEATGGQTAR